MPLAYIVFVATVPPYSVPCNVDAAPAGDPRVIIMDVITVLQDMKTTPSMAAIIHTNTACYKRVEPSGVHVGEDHIRSI